MPTPVLNTVPPFFFAVSERTLAVPTIRMPLLAAKNMAAALLPHMSRDKWGDNVLANVVLGGSDSQFAYSCDRITVGRYDLTNVATEWPDKSMLIPSEVLTALLAIGPKTLMHTPFAYEAVIVTGQSADMLTGRVPKDYEAQLSVRYVNQHKEGEPTYELHYLRVWKTIEQIKVFPPIARLFDQWLPGEEVMNPLVLDPFHLGKFTGYARRERKHLRITAPGKELDTAKRGMTNGVMVEVGTRFKGILMPTLWAEAKADEEFGTDIVAENVARDAAAKAESQPADTVDPDDGAGSARE